MAFPIFLVGVLLLVPLASSAVQPFRIDLSSEFAHMHTLIQNTRLPNHPLYPAVGIDLGIELDFLRALQTEWLDDYNWSKQESTLNELSHFTATIENLTIHFIHETSQDPDAIPLILLHGWPGKFLSRIHPGNQTPHTTLDEPNRQAPLISRRCAFLAGFRLLLTPTAKWSTNDTARVFNTLMTEILGYSKYTVHGSDRGAQIGYHLYATFNDNVRAAHVHSLPFLAPTPDQIAASNITLSNITAITEQRTVDYRATGMGYFDEQTWKPNSIGLALYDNPVGQLCWIGGNVQLWSDPRAGTPPSVLTSQTLLTMVSLYALTHTFLSSVWIYAQNAVTFSSVYTQPPTDAPLGFSVFAYDLMLWPKEYVAQATRNLAFYNEHDFGGHFPGLDNPPALIADLRELGTYFKP